MDWFAQTREQLEAQYLRGTTPWEQAGLHGNYERWQRLRRPVAEAVDRSGTFLDVGCANGFLLESLQTWLQCRDISIVPLGIDLSSPLINLARQRFPEFDAHFWTANCLEWVPPKRFDFVRTELVYVPAHLRQLLFDHLQRNYLVSGGRLLVAEYRPTNFDHASPWLYQHLQDVEVEACYQAWENEMELTRVVAVRIAL